MQTCAVADDCCPDGIDDCPGEYPWNYECTDGLCEFGGCTSDLDCSFIVGLTCEELAYTAACVQLCDDDDDCGGFGATCTGATEDGESFCLTVFECTTDDDCQGYGVCDLDTGACICESDDVCPDGWTCSMLP